MTVVVHRDLLNQRCKADYQCPGALFAKTLLKTLPSTLTPLKEVTLSSP